MTKSGGNPSTMSGSPFAAEDFMVMGIFIRIVPKTLDYPVTVEPSEGWSRFYTCVTEEKEGKLEAP